MISALLLPLLFSGSPAQPAAATRDDPSIRLWISNDRRFLPGDRATVQVQTEYDGYLIVLHVDPEGRLRVLFPLDPDKDNFMRGDKKYEVRGRGGRETFEVDGKGRGAVYAAISRDPFRFDGYVLGDHWDYRALAPSRLADDPEPELNELVQRLAQTTFDYDMLTYEVLDRSAYASTYYPSDYGSGYGDPYGYPYYGSPYGLSIGLFFGTPYRRHYYHPYYYGYDPFYSPFFYDPYYYASSYYPRYSYPDGYYGYQGRYYGYRDRYYPDRDRVYNRPNTPYRFRGLDGSTAGFRERGYDIRRSVNTVYTPPISRLREPATSTPVRRVSGSQTGDVPAGVTSRRAVGHESRLNTEAAPSRRAGESRDERPREEPRAERAREEPRAERAREPRPVERAPAPEARPQRREVARSSSPPPQARSSGRAESRGFGGGSRSDGGSRRSGGGGSRRR
jgi:uncharacterized membrane protein YgcG